jgi:hypothetical protein
MSTLPTPGCSSIRSRGGLVELGTSVARAAGLRDPHCSADRGNSRTTIEAGIARHVLGLVS